MKTLKHIIHSFGDINEDCNDGDRNEANEKDRNLLKIHKNLQQIFRFKSC